MGEALPSDTRSETPLQKEYADRDFNRPPFRFPTRDGSYQEEQALYPQISESEIFEMEAKVFTPEEFPLPPDFLPEDHPVKIAYTKLLQARNALDRGMSEVKSVEPYLVDPEGIREMTRTVRMQVGLEPMDPDKEKITERLHLLSKRARELHLKDKKKYFQRAITYLYLYKHCPEIKRSQKVDDLFDETEAIFLAHMTYAIVRSAIHEIGAERKDGGLVIDHVYAASIHGINRYMREIRNCNNPIQRHHLYHEMKLDIVRSLCHDYLEDFTMLSAAFLVNKLIEHTNFDTAIEVQMKTPRYERRSTDTNFCSKNRNRILAELIALIKPRLKKRRRGYIKKQIFMHLPLASRIPTFLTKLADRTHNLKTLNTKNIPIERQIGNIFSTIEIIETGIEAYESPELHNNKLRNTLLEELCVVVNAAITEIERLLQLEHNYHEDLRSMMVIFEQQRTRICSKQAIE